MKIKNLIVNHESQPVKLNTACFSGNDFLLDVLIDFIKLML